MEELEIEIDKPPAVTQSIEQLDSDELKEDHQEATIHDEVLVLTGKDRFINKTCKASNFKTSSPTLIADKDTQILPIHMVYHNLRLSKAIRIQ